jgi:transposase
MRPAIEPLDQEELQRILEHARAGLSQAEHQRLKAAFDTLVYLTQLVENKRTTIARLRQILFGASTEKTAAVLKAVSAALKADLAPSPTDAAEAAPARQGHGRNAANTYAGAAQIKVEHPSRHAGELCPECHRGKLYTAATPGVLVRVVGQAPLGASVYELEKLRCNLCLEVFTAPVPEALGSQKYDAGCASMIALLKYGSGVPFHRLDGLQQSLGMPLPASTQWEIVEKSAALLKPAFEELIRQAAQGEVLYNDDTTMKILVQRAAAASNEASTEPPETARSQRTGTFTSGIVSTRAGRSLALYFTGRRHAGENLATVLAHRAEALGPPIQMCDALSRNLSGEFKTIVAHCTAHARRKYVDVAPHFPEACQFVLESLAKVYKNDACCRDSRSPPQERLRFHQTHSGPLMQALENWLAEQFAQHLVEPNSGLGQAIAYMRKHWQELTLFLRQAGAPLDNNVCEQALKKAILHRKNALFYKTTKGAQVGDTFMSLIHTCGLVGANAFDYLTTLQKHAAALSQSPAQWMPWNYRQTLAHLDAA